MPAFQVGRDAFGFVTEHVAVGSLRSLNRLIEWARADVCGADFNRRFETGGSAAVAERTMRAVLLPLTETQTDDEEMDFYQHLVALRIDGLGERNLFRGAVITQLKGVLASDQDGLAELLFNRLCQIASDGAGNARKWTRTTLVQQLQGSMRLRCAPSYSADLELIQRYSSANMVDILETIGDFRIARPRINEQIQASLGTFRLVNHRVARLWEIRGFKR